jgi:hypothetical protein
MFLALSWYAISGRKWFKGPRINVAIVQEGMEPLESSTTPEEQDIDKEKKT